MNDISPSNDVDPLISPVFKDVWVNWALVEIIAPLLAKTMAKCFSNHSERNDEDDMLSDLGKGSSFNSLKMLTDENKPQEFVGIPISADGCNSKIESVVESWISLAEIKEIISDLRNTWSKIMESPFQQ